MATATVTIQLKYRTRWLVNIPRVFGVVLVTFLPRKRVLYIFNPFKGIIVHLP